MQSFDCPSPCGLGLKSRDTKVLCAPGLRFGTPEGSLFLVLGGGGMEGGRVGGGGGGGGSAVAAAPRPTGPERC